MLCRDDLKLVWVQLVSAAGCVVSLAPSVLIDAGAWLGLHVTLIEAHWVTGICMAILYLSGKLSTSPLPAAVVPKVEA